MVVFRHTHRDRYAVPVVTRELDINQTCVPGTDLTPLGIEEAKRIKFTIAKQKLPVGEVYASPTCRTKNVAQIIFGDNVKFSKHLLYNRILKQDEIKARYQWIDKFFVTPVPEGENKFVVGHKGTYKHMKEPVKVKLGEGDALVFKPNGKEPNYIGMISRKEWVH